MATKQVEVTPEVAQRLGEPIEKAQREAKERELYKRVCDLEYNAIKTRDGLRVIVRTLEEFAQTDTVNNMEEADASLIFGTVNLLDHLADECERAFSAEARP